MFKVGDILSWHPHDNDRDLYQVVAVRGKNHFDLYSLNNEHWFHNYHIEDACFQYIVVQDTVQAGVPDVYRTSHDALDALKYLTGEAVMRVSTKNIVIDKAGTFQPIVGIDYKRCSCDLYSVLLPIGCQCGGK